MDGEPQLEPNPLFSQNGSRRNKGNNDHNEEDDLAALADDDDLVAALLSIDIENENETEIIHSKEAPNNTTGATAEETSNEGLPEIELDFGDDEFLDPDQLGNVFDDPSPSQLPETEPSWESYLEDPHVDIDYDTELLYQYLANLKLHDPTSHSIKSTPLRSGTDQLPEYLFCQPCADPQDNLFDPLHSVLPPIGEDEPLPEDKARVERQPERATLSSDDDLLEDILKLSSLSLDKDDAWIREMEAKEYHEYGEVRPEAARAAKPFADAFGLLQQKSVARSCFGHKETIFGVTFSECGNYCATASQDSTINIWDVHKNLLLSSLTEHDVGYECLRVSWASLDWACEKIDRKSGIFQHLVASSSADGTVKLWSANDPSKKNGWRCQTTLDHATLLGRNSSSSQAENEEEMKEADATEDDKPQVYSLQFIDHWQAFLSDREDESKHPFLMTSSDNFVHLWEIETIPFDDRIDFVGNDKIQLLPDVIELKEVMSLHFASFEYSGYGVTPCSVTGKGLQLPSPPASTGPGTTVPFGGERNPDNMIFVFDASYCSANGLLGVALSDGSLRLVNGRGICVSILKLPGCQSHLTSFCWDSDGTRLATTVATGHLITWKLDLHNVQGNSHAVATCTAILEGGHQVGRPLFGSRFCGTKENLLLSWSVDGSLCLWDSFSYGNVHAPVAILRQDSDFPIYAVEVSSNNCVAVGGGSEGGFVGVPLYLYNVLAETASEQDTRMQT